VIKNEKVPYAFLGRFALCSSNQSRLGWRKIFPEESEVSQIHFQYQSALGLHRIDYCKCSNS
jgi:hypothetical protein